jgi:hypothetical protein
VVYVIGIIFTIVGIVFDWFNFSELRRNQQNIEKTEIESCDTDVKVYPWIYMAFVIGKMLSAVPEIVFSGISLYINSNKLIVYDTLSLITAFFLSLFQCLDLLILVIFSFDCRQPEGSNVFHDLIRDTLNDLLSGVFGTFGLIFSLTVKKNISALFKVARSCCRKNEISTTVLVFSVLLMICVLICLILAILLLYNFTETNKSDEQCTMNGGVNCTMTSDANCTMTSGANCTVTD